MFTSNNLDSYFGELSQQKWTLIPIDPVFALKLLKSAKLRKLRPAGISQGAQIEPHTRGDSIQWLDSHTGADDEVLTELELLKSALQEYFRIHLSHLECHYSLYNSGQFYVKHFDNAINDNKRIFSFVIYLNDSWTPADGGQLRAFQNENILFEIEPKLGSMILFRSDIEHEVLTTNCSRYSLTGWMRK